MRFNQRRLSSEDMTFDLLPIPDGEVLYTSNFLTPADADAYLQTFIDGIEWEQHQLAIFGRQLPAPRLSAWYGHPEAYYTYSGLRLKPQPWTDSLSMLKAQVEVFAGTTFNSVLLNQYRNGQDSMGWHSDDEPELGIEPTIASLSLGGERAFHLRHKRRKDLETVKFLLEHGSLLIMRGATQTHWKHQLPKTQKALRCRLNLSFRLIVDPSPRQSQSFS